jgi:hypothetical protein
MARKATKAFEEQGYSPLDAYCISLHEYWKSLKKAGFSEGIALFLLSDKDSYPAWILPSPVDPNKFGDYEDEDDD